MIWSRSAEVRVAGAFEQQADPQDGGLIELAIAGDHDAFDALIRPRLDRLFRLAVAITRSHADARDATQEACVKAWRELPRLRQRDRFDAWLNQIVVNAARMTVRSRGRREVREVSRDDGSRATPLEPAVPSDSDAFADADAIRRAFGRLDGTTRALLILHYVEGAPLGDIARATASPVGTVKWRLSRARKALEEALEVEER
jgi:RNA polymerase sigma-70 factor (ECF subfamily)